MTDQETERRRFLTEKEMRKLLDASKKGRHGERDHLLVLMAYRHGLRVSELIDIRMGDLDLEASRIYVRRLKGSTSTHQPMTGDELRAVRAWLLARGETISPFLFLNQTPRHWYSRQNSRKGAKTQRREGALRLCAFA